MAENIELLKDKLFSHEMTRTELTSLDKESFTLLFSPSSYKTIHESKRVLLFDSILELLIRFYNLNELNNGLYIVHRDSLIRTIHGARRYLFHGGDRGRFDGFFSLNDDFFVIRKPTGADRTADSVPRWNLAHLFCDYLDTDEKCRSAVEWMFSDYCWMDSLHMKVNSAFHGSNLNKV